MTSISTESIHATWRADLTNHGFNFIHVTNDDTIHVYFRNVEIASCTSLDDYAALGALYAECYAFLHTRNKVKGSYENHC